MRFCSIVHEQMNVLLFKNLELRDELVAAGDVETLLEGDALESEQLGALETGAGGTGPFRKKSRFDI